MLDFNSDETYKDHTCECTGTDISGLSGGVVTKPANQYKAVIDCLLFCPDGGVISSKITLTHFWTDVLNRTFSNVIKSPSEAVCHLKKAVPSLK